MPPIYIERAIIFILTTIFFIIGPRYFTHIISKEIQMIIYAILSFVIVMIFGVIRYHIEITEKPIQITKAKVISKEYRGGPGRGDIYSNYYAIFLVDNENKFELAISKKQYNAINKNDIVELVYQGVIAYSIKNLADGTVTIYKSYDPKDMKFK